MSATAFVTPQALIDEFGTDLLVQLTDRGTPRTHAVDTAVAQGACDRVSVEITAVVALRYAVPLAVVPAILTYIARDMALFYLHRTEPADWIKTRFDSARAQLKSVGNGGLSLGLDVAGTGDAEAAQAQENLPQFADAGKVFGRYDIDPYNR